MSGSSNSHWKLKLLLVVILCAAASGVTFAYTTHFVYCQKFDGYVKFIPKQKWTFEKTLIDFENDLQKPLTFKDGLQKGLKSWLDKLGNETDRYLMKELAQRLSEAEKERLADDIFK